jgi:superoxide dismutase, Fe-Mn family
VSHYVLPELPFEYDALEPHLSARILQLHHDKHHRAYVDGANDAIEKLIEARRADSFETIALLEKKLAFNVSGHVLHSVFWQNLRPGGGGQPQGELGRAIARDFGSFDRFKKQMNQVAVTVMGSGWSALVWDPVLKRLGTTQIHDHQNDLTVGGIPLLVMDAWEHAYYLQYLNEKAKFFEALWNLWNWDDVARRLDAARKSDLLLVDAAEEPGEPAPVTH